VPFTGKKEKTTPSEPEKTFSEKIANAEESLKKMKQSIGSFLGGNVVKMTTEAALT